MRLGILGGTFDPIHLGHMAIAKAAYRQLNLDRVCFIPAGDPPHKDIPGATAAQRLEMVRLATQGLPWAKVSDMEVRRQGPSYTVDTLKSLESKAPHAQRFFIIGSDTLPLLISWKDIDKIVTLCTFAVIERGGEEPSAPPIPGLIYEWVHETPPPISSTQIRERVKAGEGLKGLTPPAVAAFIKEAKLYG